MLRLPERTADTDPLIKFLKKEKKTKQNKKRIQNLTIKFDLGWMFRMDVWELMYSLNI